MKSAGRTSSRASLASSPAACETRSRVNVSPEPACPVNIYVHRNIIIGACSERADLKAMRTRAARRVGSSTESLPGVIPRFGCSDSEDACARSGTDPTVTTRKPKFGSAKRPINGLRNRIVGAPVRICEITVGSRSTGCSNSHRFSSPAIPRFGCSDSEYACARGPALTPQLRQEKAQIWKREAANQRSTE